MHKLVGALVVPITLLVFVAPARADKASEFRTGVAIGTIAGKAVVTQSDVDFGASDGGPIASVARVHHVSKTRWEWRSLFGNEVVSITAVTKWNTRHGHITWHETTCSTHTSTFWDVNEIRKAWKWLPGPRRHSRGNSWCHAHFWSTFGFSFLSFGKSTRVKLGSIVNWRGARRHWRDGGT